MSGDFFNDVDRNTFAVVLFEDLPKIDTKNFKDHAKVISIRTFIEKSIEQIQNVAVISIIFFLVRFIIFQ